MFFLFTAPIAYSLFVTRWYFCEEIRVVIIVGCRAPRRDEETTASDFTGYPRSVACNVSLRTGWFCPLVELGGSCWEEQAQTQTSKKLILTIPKCEMLSGNKAQIKLISHNTNSMKMEFKAVIQASAYSLFETLSWELLYIVLFSAFFYTNECLHYLRRATKHTADYTPS